MRSRPVRLQYIATYSRSGGMPSAARRANIARARELLAASEPPALPDPTTKATATAQKVNESDSIWPTGGAAITLHDELSLFYDEIKVVFQFAVAEPKHARRVDAALGLEDVGHNVALLLAGAGSGHEDEGQGDAADAILAGTEGPDHTYKLPSNIQKHLEDLAAVIKADPVVGKEIPDFLGLMKSVFDQLDAKPETVEITDSRTRLKVKVIVNKFVMQFIVANNIGTTVTARFPALFYRASKGDFTNPAQVWLNQSRSEIGSAMSYMMDCASGQTAARREQIAREAKGTLLEDIFNFPFPDVCTEWNAPDLGDEFRAPLKSDVPVLFISGTLDARTPISNAEEYRKGFSNSTHMIIEGAVHSDPLFLSSPKIKEGMMEFLRGQPVTTTKITGAPIKFVL